MSSSADFPASEEDLKFPGDKQQPQLSDDDTHVELLLAMNEALKFADD